MAVEQRCTDLGSGCICSEPFQGTITGGPDFWTTNDSNKHCTAESAVPSAVGIRTSNTVTMGTDSAVLAQLPNGHSVIKYVRAENDHQGTWSIGHGDGINVDSSFVRIASRWYAYHTTTFDFKDEGTCNNSKFTNNNHGVVVDYTGGFHIYNFLTWSPSVDCCVSGPGPNPGVPTADMKNKWWRFELIFTNRSGPDFRAQFFGKNITDDAAELEILDLWDNANVDNLTPPGLMSMMHINNHRFSASGSCRGWIGNIFYMYAGWTTNSGQRIGASQEVEPGAAPDTTPPTLSSPANGTETADGTIGASVSTNEGNGTLYWAVLTDSGTCTGAQLKAGSGGNIVAGKAGNQGVTATGTQTIATITGLSAGTNYELNFLHTDGALNDSSQATVALLTLSADVTAPVLSSPNNGTETSTGTTNATVSSANDANGTLYWAVVTNAGSCTDAQLKAGSGGDIVAGVSGNQGVTATGTQTVASIAGLSSATTYQIKFLHRDASGNDSAQASVSLTTLAVAPVLSNGTIGTLVYSVASETGGFPNGAGFNGAHVDTDGSDGTLYWMIISQEGVATNAEVIAGSAASMYSDPNHGDVYHGTQAVTASGQQASLNFTKCWQFVNLQLVYLHVSAGALESNKIYIPFTNLEQSEAEVTPTPVRGSWLMR